MRGSGQHGMAQRLLEGGGFSFWRSFRARQPRLRKKYKTPRLAAIASEM